jgi:hypothetical protein
MACAQWQEEWSMMKSAMKPVLLALLGCLALAQPSDAKTGYLRVIFAKAAVIAGAGAGRGVLTFDGRDHPFRVYGLSVGVTVGASASRLAGRAAYLNQLSDFEGTYTAVGTGGALVGGGGGVQLKNDKGVIITLHGPKAGLEFAANLSGIRIELAERPTSS